MGRHKPKGLSVITTQITLGAVVQVYVQARPSPALGRFCKAAVARLSRALGGDYVVRWHQPTNAIAKSRAVIHIGRSTRGGRSLALLTDRELSSVRGLIRSAIKDYDYSAPARARRPRARNPRGQVRTARDERLWTRAKDRAADQGRPRDWAYVSGIYKRLKKPRANPRAEIDLGPVAALEYEGYDDEHGNVVFRHEFDEHAQPDLYADEQGELVLEGGDYNVDPYRGIVDEEGD